MKNLMLHMSSDLGGSSESKVFLFKNFQIKMYKI
jgi:hypothetical protein